MTPAEIASLPSDLDARLTSVRQKIIPLVESWTRITSTADRLAHRRQNQGKEFASLRDAFEGAVELAQGAWRPNEVGQSERHIRSVATLAGEVAETNETSAQRTLDTVVESLKQVGHARSMVEMVGQHPDCSHTPASGDLYQLARSVRAASDTRG